MTRTFSCALWLACLLAGSAATAGSSTPGTEQPPSTKDVSVRHHNGNPLYFVHLADSPLPVHARLQKRDTGAFANGKLQVHSAGNREYRARLQAQQGALESSIVSITNGNAEVTHRMQLALNALVVAIRESDVDAIRALPGVKRVERVETREMLTDRGPDHIGATAVWAGVRDFAGTLGEGITIGIIDSGIRPDHPSFAERAEDGYVHVNPLGRGVYLGDCIDEPGLCNEKLIGVISYPEITYAYGDKRPHNGWDYNGHGTHVASIAAGNILNDVPIYNVQGDASEYTLAQVSGVAPRANIVSYQVCYPQNGGCNPALAALSVEHAIEHGIDVINYSVGGGALSPWNNADGQAFLSARAAGIHVATSAGNSGPGPSTIGTPGNAPWLSSVAAYTHDRDYEDAFLIDFSGGTEPPGKPIEGKGLTRGFSGPVVHARDYGDGQCMEPFSEGTFRGEIVVCERGYIARVEKGSNVLAGGAGGMILINVLAADTDTVTDPHVLPAIHLDKANGQLVLDWLAEGEDHAVTIKAAGTTSRSEKGNIAGVFTSRGPALPYGDIPAPHMAAPGVGIYAAWVDDAPFRDQEFVAPFAFLDGTSMSSPHVAGALALLKATHPTWTPAEAQSALMLTADSETFGNHEGAPSTLFDAGSGMINVAAALNAGFVMDEQELSYLAANPEIGGSPSTLNLPALANSSCLLRCTWTRTIRGTKDSNWTVALPAIDGVSLSVEPSAFSLLAGAEQELTIVATVSGESLPAEWVHGRIVFLPDDRDALPAGMPFAIRFDAGNAPEHHVISTRRDAGSQSIAGFRSIASDSLHVNTMGLVRAQRHEAFLKGDPTPAEPFLDYEGFVHVVTVNVNTRTRALVAEILEAEAPDLDLYIARDANLDGKPSGWELYYSGLCISGSPASDERCVVYDPEPGVYWIAVHNFEASMPDATDRHVLSVAVIEDKENGLTVQPPDAVETDIPFNVHAAWNLPMQAGDSFYSIVELGTTEKSAGDIGRTLLRIDRVDDDFALDVDRTTMIAGESATFSWSVSSVPTDHPSVAYRISTEVPPGFVIDAVDGKAGNASNSVDWEFTQAPGAPARTGTLRVQSEKSDDALTLQPVFLHSAANGPTLEARTPMVQVKPTPKALINGKASASLTVDEGKTLNIDASASTNGDQFHWQQLEGPAAAIEALEGTGKFRLSAPMVTADTILKYRLTVSMDGVTGEPADLVVTVKDKPVASVGSSKRGGGSTGILFLLALLGLRYAARRFSGIT